LQISKHLYILVIYSVFVQSVDAVIEKRPLFSNFLCN